MLCYAPLHHLLFAQPGIEVLVMTSANLAEEPLISDNDAAVSELKETADYFLVHNRPIYRRIDDSVVHIIGGAAAFLRRARGYVPEPIFADRPAQKHIFAAGADLKNTFCMFKDGQYILSEHIGDLENPKTYRHYADSVAHLAGLLKFKPSVVACDLHPGYLSTKFARDLAGSLGVEKIIPVQHHWAHAASVMAEFNVQSAVIGLIADGTGYGTDGAVWGCECLVCSLTEFERFGCMDYFPLAGGDMAAIEAIRPVLGLLGGAGADTGIAEILRKIEPNAAKVALIVEQIEKSVNTVPSSSLGRLFDAAAALLGLGSRNFFEAQLPMALESIAQKDIGYAYPVNYDCRAAEPVKWLASEMILCIIDDIRRSTSKEVIAARFHNTVCDALLGFAEKAREKTGICDVAIAGGVFCNRYIANRLITNLQAAGFRVFFNRRSPANDGGIALGQAAIAATVTGVSR
jgi:hydrogenase maturation protein HypF